MKGEIEELKKKVPNLFSDLPKLSSCDWILSKQCVCVCLCVGHDKSSW